MKALTRAKSANGFADYDAAELMRTVEALTNETEDLHAAAIAFVLQEKTVATALVGARSREQLLDSIIAYEKGCSI